MQECLKLVEHFNAKLMQLSIAQTVMKGQACESRKSLVHIRFMYRPFWIFIGRVLLPKCTTASPRWHDNEFMRYNPRYHEMYIIEFPSETETRSGPAKDDETTSNLYIRDWNQSSLQHQPCLCWATMFTKSSSYILRPSYSNYSVARSPRRLGVLPTIWTSFHPSIYAVSQMHCLKSSTGIQLIPHVGFWMDYPALVMDGVQYAMQSGCPDLFFPVKKTHSSRFLFFSHWFVVHPSWQFFFGAPSVGHVASYFEVGVPAHWAVCSS